MSTGSGIWRFVANGVRDAERRLQRVSQRDAPLDPEVVRTIEHSAVVRSLDAALAWLRDAGQSSALLSRARAMWTGWRARPFAARRRQTGGMLLIAVLVHVLLTAAVGPAPGWLWLILPGLVAAAGLLLLA